MTGRTRTVVVPGAGSVGHTVYGSPVQGSSWQCLVCGTVYAWWVSRCREKHTLTNGASEASS